MSRILQADTGEVKNFIDHRIRSHPKFGDVVAVSVDKYPSEFFATIWVGREPDPEMRQYANELEVELGNLGVSCGIIVKTDRELFPKETRGLRTEKGDFSFHYYQIDPVRDEDAVYVFAVYRGNEMYRFRMSLSGTLASMLRSRNRFREDWIVEIYLDRIRSRIETGDLVPEKTEAIMFDSRDLAYCVGS